MKRSHPSEPDPLTRQRACKLRVAALCISIVTTLFLSEIAIRMAVGNPIRWRFPQEMYVPDSRLGHRLRPNQSAFTHDKPVRINSYGLRDREQPLKGKVGRWRALALGDSQTFGIGLREIDTWPRLLEQYLSSSTPGGSWEIINAGVPATDTWQHELMLAERLEQFHPDLVILAFYVNDVSAKPDRVSLMPGMSNPGWSRRAGYILKRSALFCAFWRARSSLTTLLGMQGPDFEQKVVAGKSEIAVERAWEQVERSLASMKEQALRGKSRLWLVFLPRQDQISGGANPKPFVERVTGITGRLSIPMINPLTALQLAYEHEENRLFITWDGHNSREANVIIAEAIASAISDFGRSIPP